MKCSKISLNTSNLLSDVDAVNGHFDEEAVQMMSKLGNKIKVFQMLIIQFLNNTMDEVHNLHSASKRHLITNVISTSDH